jgi:hypothetical protein
MNNSKKIKRISIIFIAALIFGAVYFTIKHNSSDRDVPIVADSKIVNKSLPKIKKIILPPVIIEAFELSEFPSVNAEEKKSLLTLSLLLEEAVNGESTMNTLIEKLDHLRLKPIVMKDENPHTGALSIVRTKETLPGTRYIHAQYFSDENGVNSLQHMSFEFHGSQHSFEAVKKIIQKQFRITASPSLETPKFISWKIDGRNIWIKKLDLEDMKKKSPFNSYDPIRDIGTIRVTNEAEIH